MDTHAHTYKYCQAKCKAKRKHDELGNIKCKGVIQGWVLWSVNAPTHMHTRTHTHIYTVSMGVWCHVWIYIYIYLFIFILHHTPHPPTGCHFRKMLCFKKFFFFSHFSFCSRFKDMQSHHSSADGARGSQREGGSKRKREFSAFSIMKHLVEPWSHGFGSEKGWGWATGGGGGGWGGCFSSCHFTQKQLFEWGEHGKREWDIKKRDIC